MCENNDCKYGGCKSEMKSRMSYWSSLTYWNDSSYCSLSHNSGHLLQKIWTLLCLSWDAGTNSFCYLINLSYFCLFVFTVNVFRLSAFIFRTLFILSIYYKSLVMEYHFKSLPRRTYVNSRPANINKLIPLCLPQISWATNHAKKMTNEGEHHSRGKWRTIFWYKIEATFWNIVRRQEKQRLKNLLKKDHFVFNYIYGKREKERERERKKKRESTTERTPRFKIATVPMQVAINSWEKWVTNKCIKDWIKHQSTN